MNLSSGMSAERFFFPGTIYSDELPTMFSKKIHSRFIYTMNVTEAQVKSYNLKEKWDIYHLFSGILIGKKPAVLYAYKTYQFTDYEKYESWKFSVTDKTLQKKEQFPKHCEHAFRMGE